MGLVKTKSLLREKVWFPNIDKLAKEEIDNCLPCQSIGPANPPEPLHMNKMPKGPWQTVHMDFFGPLPSGEYYLLTNWLAYLYGQIQSPRPDVMPDRREGITRAAGFVFACIDTQAS